MCFLVESPAACLPMPHASMDRACAFGMCPAMCWAGRMSCVAAADACCPVPHPRAFAGAQTHSPWGAALVKGMMCNWLVCLAVWQATAAQDIVGKIVGIYCAQPPAPFPTLPRALLPCRACRDGTATSCGSPVRTSLHGAPGTRCIERSCAGHLRSVWGRRGKRGQLYVRIVVQSGPHGICCASV